MAFKSVKADGASGYDAGHAVKELNYEVQQLMVEVPKQKMSKPNSRGQKLLYGSNVICVYCSINKLLYGSNVICVSCNINKGINKGVFGCHFFKYIVQIYNSIILFFSSHKYAYPNRNIFNFFFQTNKSKRCFEFKFISNPC